MNFRTKILCPLLLSPMFFSNAFAQQGLPTLELTAEAEVQIGTDGHVHDYRLTSALAPAVASLVDRSVRSWSFEPVLFAGAPVMAKTSMHLHLKAEPRDESNVTLRIVAVDFGQPKRNGRMKPPKYPADAVRRALGAKVLLAVRLDDQGQVVDVLPYQTSLDERASSENEAEHWRRVFEQASITAAKTWRYDLTEMVNGKKIGTTAMVPVEYTVTHVPGRRVDGWRAFLPGPVHSIPWLNSTALVDTRDVSSLKDGEAQSLDSQFKLKSNVVGTTL